MLQARALSDDSLRAVIDTVLSRPDYHWTDAGPRTNWLVQAFRDLVGWLDGLRSSNPTLFTVIIWGLIALLVAILVHGGFVMYRTVRGAAAAPDRGLDRAPGVVRDEAWYRAEAGRLARAGRFAEAMQASFAALIRRLDAGEVVRYHPAKTPREYVREARLSEPDRGRFQWLVQRLYACAYAGDPCGPAEYQDWLRASGEASGATPD